MATNAERKIILVTRRTRIEELVTKYQTLAQAKFHIEHLGADFRDYQREHQNYQQARRVVMETLEARGRYQVIDRGFLPNFLFGPHDVVIALGQDGLVVNAMKYLEGQPLIGVNPDPLRFDGILLPFEPRDLPSLLRDVERDHRPARSITMAQANLTDGQSLYAVNDLFVGPRSHTSARYEIRLGEAHETQSSSGIIVATGLGSTGWMTSVVTGAMAIAQAGGATLQSPSEWTRKWDSPSLRFAVREPFPSKSSRATLVVGDVTPQQPLELRSHMSDNGVIFSDGVEADYLAFNAGMLATISVADRKGNLVI